MAKFIKIKYILPLLIIIGGILIMMGLSANRKPPAREERQYAGVLVQVIEAEAGNRQVMIVGTGTVSPRYEFNLVPQVSGIVEWVHPDLATGGRFAAGDTLLKIEAKDYLLAVQQAEAAVAQAQYQLELEQANSEIALEEWKLMNGDLDQSEPDPLVLREPQLRQANASMKSAQASLEMAKLSLGRTALRAPYNCRVRNMSVSPGQLVGLLTPLASLYSADAVEVAVGLSMADLPWIEVPGASAVISLDTGEEVLQWNCYVDRSTGVLDAVGRMAQVVVRVNDPFSQSKSTNELNIGSFVKVTINGRTLENTVALPRAAVRENSTVWIAAEDNTLEIRSVNIQRLTPIEALVARGIKSGDRVITTSISGASNGMKLRILTGEDQ
ncbi:efflux RND transporter periplasmic adaptor subunit [bacterium]|nr:efflux RND transporter periplasmic adaptor subunit [bacterium]MBU1651320.1 efflux RND transporter periplasmic adaptor subunit [bacterium]MBU1881470.1 efflux RND transporter periplasmic adaptor subunit [bacterium]